MWTQIGVCPDWNCDERLWHGGLSEDGRKCFISGFEDNVYIVWDVTSHCVIWRDEGSNEGSERPPLDKWIDSDGYITLPTGPAAGRYRVFGLSLNHAKVESATLDQRLEVDAKQGIVSVRKKSTGTVVCRLSFDAFSGDWAFASFSDNDAVIAVIEPYSVTFFGRTEDPPNA